MYPFNCKKGMLMWRGEIFPHAYVSVNLHRSPRYQIISIETEKRKEELCYHRSTFVKVLTKLLYRKSIFVAVNSVFH